MKNVKNGALSNLRILDATHALAGPFCAQILGDHGADIIKIEPLHGDFFRKMGPFLPDDKERVYGGPFQSCNRNKKSIAIDLKSDKGRALFKTLVADSDAVIENFRAGVFEKMGLGYDVLSRINPRLVYTSIRGFGDVVGGESPYMAWPAFDIIAQAMGGWMSITGTDKEHSLKAGGGLGDTVSGLFAAMGTLTALWHARETGEGQYVDIAMLDSVLALSEMVTATYGYTGKSPSPVGNGMPGMVPFGSFPAKDGEVVIAAPHDPMWKDLCMVMETPDLITDDRFKSERARAANQPAVYEIVSNFTRQYTKAELKEIMGGKVPFGPVYIGEDIFNDPHFEVRDMLPKVEHPGTGRTVKVAGTPIKLEKTPGSIRTAAPLLGEHTSIILGDFGLSTEEISALYDSQTIK
ncbi:MAG: CoA transferase [Emcibacter sp.]|nr:CoA transferase [Emcibacter sp.]